MRKFLWILVIALCNPAFAGNAEKMNKEWRAGEKQRLERAAEILYQELLEDCAFPDEIVDYITYKITILERRTKNHASPDHIWMIQRLYRALEIAKRRDPKIQHSSEKSGNVIETHETSGDQRGQDPVGA